ncbi:MAG TPA: EAL domain-containing protein [Polyangiaceae bacterium]|nr:EAL domain-containing protein [Polyangiaceae bacterium]
MVDDSARRPHASEKYPSSGLSPKASPADDSLRQSYIAMHKIVQKEDLSCVFQPIIDIHTGVAFATEALVRCRIPEFQDPLALFRHAVAAKCCGRLGRMIRDIAIPLCSGAPIFVNIHPNELSERWLVRPDDPIFGHDEQVFLEITESVPFTHFQLCLDVLKEVRSRGGVHLVVDDLGAGYSNLGRIADLEPKFVKLDRDLVTQLDRYPRRRQLVTSIVRLCVELGASVVAEGIETRDEYSAICDTGAQYGQGYLFARPAFPMPAITWPPPLFAAPAPPKGGILYR